MVNSTSLFHRQTGKVRDSETVLVLREVSTDGVVLYRKRFKNKGFDIWASRENQFFSLFSLKKLQRVVRPETIKNSAQGGVFEVVTFDAGLTIEEWLQVRLSNRAGHVFALGEDFMRLTRACLLALQEIHRSGVMHCDIKPDNICLPYTPTNVAPDLSQPIKIDFEHIRLIDFSFSLSKDIPLENNVLPLDSRSSYADYLSPAFKAALQADQQTGKPEQTQTLTPAVDWYSLGFMLNNLLTRDDMVWSDEQSKTLVRDLVQALMDVKAPMDSGMWLCKLDDSLSRAPAQQSLLISQTHSPVNLGHATPLLATPLIATPLVNAPVDKPVNKKLPQLSLLKKYWPWLGGGLAAMALIGLIMAFSGGDDGMNMVAIPNQKFEIGKHEVTQAQWQKIMGENSSQFKNCANCPVEFVTWNEVQVFLQKLNSKTGKKYRLPSSEEWEYACMGGAETRYCGGDDVDVLAWHQDNSEARTHPVGQKQPNAYGLYDMSGNVSEWVADCHDNDCSDHIVRGGSWVSEAQNSRSRRAARRDELRIQNAYSVPATSEGNNLGFRLARNLN